MGDVIHTLPAVTDAARSLSEIHFDWLVEDTFAEIPGWHRSVQRVIPVSLRRWRKHPWRSLLQAEWRESLRQLRVEKYDLVIDAQGLIKSALLSCLVSAPTAGFDKHAAREPLASMAYRVPIDVAREMHAVERSRQLFAKTLGYPCPPRRGEYGLRLPDFHRRMRDTHENKTHENKIVFVHATSRSDKLWPESYWQQLCRQLAAAGFSIHLPWGTLAERERATRIAGSHGQATVLPQLSLHELAVELLAAKAVVAVDTGLGHLSAALSVPTVSLYGSTSPELVGAYGAMQYHLCAKDFARTTSDNLSSLEHITPEIVCREVLGSVQREAA